MPEDKHDDNAISGQQSVLFVPQRKYKQTTLTIVLPILILGWVSMMAILIPVKSGEKISFLIAIELGLVFIIATLDTNMVPAGRGFKARNGIMILSFVIFVRKARATKFLTRFKLPFICWVVLINHITLLQSFLFILFFQDKIFRFWTYAIVPRRSDTTKKRFWIIESDWIEIKLRHRYLKNGSSGIKLNRCCQPKIFRIQNLQTKCFHQKFPTNKNGPDLSWDQKS